MNQEQKSVIRAICSSNIPELSRLLPITGGVNQRIQGEPLILKCCSYGIFFNIRDPLKYLLAQPGIDVNARRTVNDDVTPLISSIQSSDRSRTDDWPDLSDQERKEPANNYITMLLLNHEGIDLNKTFTTHGVSPLFKACQTGNAKIVKVLLRTGLVDINRPTLCNEKVSPLLCAIQNGHKKVVKVLLKDCNIDINQPGSEKAETPLMYAIWKNRPDIVKLLVSTGKLDLKAAALMPLASNGSTVLIEACFQGMVELIELLLQQDGIDVNIAKTDVYGTTPLIAACEKGEIGVVKLLLAQKNIDVNKGRKVDRHTPLIRTIHRGMLKQSAKIAKLLLATGQVDINKEVGAMGTVNRTTPLISSCMLGHTAMSKLLIKKGADPNLADSCGRTPLNVTEMFRMEDITLFQPGNIDPRNKEDIIKDTFISDPPGMVSNDKRSEACEATAQMLGRRQAREDRKANSICMVCHVKATDLGVKKFKICPCKDPSAIYCGTVCRKKHWKSGGHKQTCTARKKKN
jgi:ankyrin repeat protein